ncbi:myeloperoxidase-like isoform X2 [Branchiostoma floridae x Branchiostoma belcheri]
MLTRLIPMLFAAVAMAPLVVMVTGQSPTEQELQQAVAQAKAEMEAEAAAHVVSGGAEPDEGPFSGALNALAREHRSTPMAKELSRRATVLEKVAKHFMSSSRRRTSSYTIAMLSAIDSPSVTSVCDDTSMESITCPTPAVPEFRSANGRCNNRDHPLWGSSEEPFRRLLEPEYGDGLMIPRKTGRDGAPLPSARLVSTTMHEDLRKSSPVNTHMVMQFGQFLDHDITLTPNFQEEGLVCTCDSEDEHCFNINIPSNDPDFSGRPCLQFARSLSGPNEGCHLGRRQQLNQLTAFVDASNVYGSSDEEIEELREHAEVNVAVSKTATQSSLFGSIYPAERAVDGNTGTILYPLQQCTHTGLEYEPWWKVDLGDTYVISHVTVINRGDCCGERLRNFMVRVGPHENLRENTPCGDIYSETPSEGETIDVRCEEPISGRWVSVQLIGREDYLSLCEVQVFAGTGARGLLKSRPNPADENKKELLPGVKEPDSRDPCDEFRGSETCSLAGDIRVNEQPGLTSMHTVFLREHNRIARRLSQLNPHWDDDRVFFETRKIVGALMQKITYGEDLPHVLGPAAMTKFHLTLLQSGFFSGYDASVNPTISNVFATAAYRFGHSLINNFFLRHAPDFNEASACPIRLAFSFFNPSHIFNNDQGGPDSILRGLTAQPHQDFDRFMVSGLTKQLFADPPGSDRGLDLAALNIQRGRDHGLPGYNAWRVRCGLPKANSFDDLESEIPDRCTRIRLEDVYSHVDDIDVFVGGLAEESVPGGVVGPTFACLMGLQFQDLRKGDRFWFENPGQFTAAQLTEIRKTSLARILCDNTDGTTHMQPDVFRLPTQAGNERVACSSLSQMDLTKWQESVANSRGLPESLEGENAAMSGREFEDHDADEVLERVAEEARTLLELLRGKQGDLTPPEENLTLRGGQDDIYREDNAGSGGELDTNDLGFIDPEEYGQDMANNLE